MDFNEKDWIARMREAKTDEAFRALLEELPKPDIFLMPNSARESFIMEQQQALKHLT